MDWKNLTEQKWTHKTAKKKTGINLCNYFEHSKTRLPTLVVVSCEKNPLLIVCSVTTLKWENNLLHGIHDKDVK